MDLGISLGGLLVGLTVGLTGMGGGALMTPMLVLLFGVDPLAAVSTDVVASLVMKPIGGSVHARRGTVHLGIVRWLALGSVPAAFASPSSHGNCTSTAATLAAFQQDWPSPWSAFGSALGSA